MSLLRLVDLDGNLSGNNMAESIYDLVSALRKEQSPATPLGPSTNAPMQDIYATMGARPTDIQMAMTQRNLLREQGRSTGSMPPATRNTARGWTVASNPLEHLGQTLQNLGSQKKARGLEKTLGRQAEDRQLADSAIARHKSAKDDYRWAMEFGQESAKIKATQELKLAEAAREQAWKELQYDTGRRDRLRTDMRRLSEDIAPVTATSNAIRTLDEKMAPYMPGGELYDKKNLPGVGLLEGDPGWLGSATRLVQDLRVPGSPNADMYASVRGVLNQLIKQDAGLQQTIHEMRNQLTAAGLEGLTDEEVFISTYPAIRKRQEAKVDNILGGYGEDVTQAYLSRNPGLTDPFEDFENINARRREQQIQQAPQQLPDPAAQWSRSPEASSAAQGRPVTTPAGTFVWSGSEWVPQGQTGQIQRGPQ